MCVWNNCDIFGRKYSRDEICFLERLFCAFLWSFTVLYSLYELYLFGQSFNRSEWITYHNVDFEIAWFNRYKDISDFEWNCWSILTLRLCPWLLLNFVCSMSLRASKIKSFGLSCYVIISISAVSAILSPAAAGLLTILALSFYGVAFLKNPLCICAVAWLWRRFIPSSVFVHSDNDIYILEVAASWMVLRCLAYCFEVCKGGPTSLISLMAFAFYLPTLFCGPFINFTGFVRHISSKPPILNIAWAVAVIRGFTKCIIWCLFTNIALHFVYANAIVLRPYMVVGMTLWQLAGLGIAMGHYFHLKYVVFYGLPTCWASAEGFPVPDSPCCVSTVSLYSVMWRRFDPGLYSFLIRYIYIPVSGSSLGSYRILRKTGALVACFFFVFVWHGEEEYVLYWVLLNLTAVTMEGVAKEISRVPAVRKKLNEKLSEANQRRLLCLLVAPLHYFSMLSNYFFIGSLDIGKIYFHRAVRETFINNLYILCILYGAAQTNVSIKSPGRKIENK